VYDKDAVYITINDKQVTYTPAHLLLADTAARALNEGDDIPGSGAGAVLPAEIARRLGEKAPLTANLSQAAIDELGGEALVRSLQTVGSGATNPHASNNAMMHYNTNSASSKGIDTALETEHTISLFKGGKSITAAQFDKINAIRKEGYDSDALPAALRRKANSNNSDDDDEDEDADAIKNARAGAGGDTKDGEDAYERLQVKEVRGADGRVRRQVIFADDDVNNNDGDDDSDDDGDDDNGGDDDDFGGARNDDDYYNDDDDDDVDASDREDGEGDEGDYNDEDEDALEGELDDEDEDDEDATPEDATDYFASEFSGSGSGASAKAGKSGKKALLMSDDGDDNEDLGDHAADWKQLLADRARSMARSVSLTELVYGADGVADALGKAADDAATAAKLGYGDGSDDEDNKKKKSSSGDGNDAEEEDGEDEEEEEFFKPRVAVTARSSLNHARAGSLANNPKRAGNEAGSTNVHGAHAGGQGVSAADTVLAGDGVDSTLRLRKEKDMRAWGEEAVDRETVMRNRFVTGDWGAEVGVAPDAAPAQGTHGGTHGSGSGAAGMFGATGDAQGPGFHGAADAFRGDDENMETLWGGRDSERMSKTRKAGLALSGGAGGAADGFLEEDDALGTGLGGDGDADGNGNGGDMDEDERIRARLDAKIKLKHQFIGDLERRVAGELAEDAADDAAAEAAANGEEAGGEGSNRKKKANDANMYKGREPRAPKDFSHKKAPEYDFFAAQKHQVRKSSYYKLNF